MLKKIVFFLLALNLGLTKLYSNDKLEIGIEHDKKLGTYLDMNMKFTDSDGKLKTLKELIDKPTILSLVYYHCPGICSPLLTNLSKVVEEAKVEPGKEYKILSISFDPREDAATALKWQTNYLSSMTRAVSPKDWHFMVGDSLNDAKITDAVGFRYKPDGKGDFIHAGGLMVIAPDGKITRYLLGTEFNPFDFKLAIYESQKGISAPPITKLLAYCYKYDPNGNKYVFNINRVAGTFIFLGAGIFFVVLLIKGRSKKVNKGEQNG
jgi:protein SCO1/2